MDSVSVTRASSREIEDEIMKPWPDDTSELAQKEYVKFVRKRHKVRQRLDQRLNRLALEQLEALDALIDALNKF